MIEYLLLGLIFGGLGQLVRGVIGLKKLDTSLKELSPDLDYLEFFSTRRFLLSVALGCISGMFAALILFESQSTMIVSKEAAILMLSAGYAGSDFIEGYLETQSKDL